MVFSAGTEFYADRFSRCCRAASVATCAIHKARLHFHRTRFPGLFGLNTVSSPELPRERLSTDRSALHILRAPAKFGTGLLLLLRDQILEFYFINILSPWGVFFLGEGRSGQTLFSLGLSAFPAGMQTWPLSLTFNPICHVDSCLQYPEGWSCAGHRNKSVTLGRGMFITTINPKHHIRLCTFHEH